MMLAPLSERQANDDPSITVEWPDAVVQCFGTLTAMLRDARASDDAVLCVPTASSSDVLVFVGCIAEWHRQNDALFTTVLARELSVEAWHARRDAAVVAFDEHFCGAALAQKRGFFGELLRSADFLEGEWLLYTLVKHVTGAVENSVRDAHRIEALCGAIVG